MQDRQNARLMGVAPTGNGRRESFAHPPMPRMTNTDMLGGDADPADIVADLRDGLYAVGFGGGQVDITNGKFVSSCTEAYRVKNGKVGAPVKGATLIGDGATALQKIRALGNDMALDPGMGNCGKAGQRVPVRRRPTHGHDRRADRGRFSGLTGLSRRALSRGANNLRRLAAPWRRPPALRTAERSAPRRSGMEMIRPHSTCIRITPTQTPPSSSADPGGTDPYDDEIRH